MIDSSRRFSVLIIGLLLLLSGCQSTAEFKEPQLRLLKVEVKEINLLEQKFILHVQVDNPNPIPFSLSRLDYQLWLNDMEIGGGQLNKNFSVGVNDSRRVAIPLRTNIWQHLKPLSEALKNSQVPLRYRLQGKVKTDLLFGQSLPFYSQGEIIPSDYLPEM